MARPGRAIVYPTFHEVCEANRRLVTQFGGYFVPPRNLSNEASLHYALDAMRRHFDQPATSADLKEQASFLCERIIRRHVFVDGNKRTGLHIAWAFLERNGVHVVLDPSAVELLTSVAAGATKTTDVLSWFHEHQAD
jgi:death on curing protein